MVFNGDGAWRKHSKMVLGIALARSFVFISLVVGITVLWIHCTIGTGGKKLGSLKRL